MNQRIKELRNKMGLSMEKFGARIGLTRSAISKIESGSNPSEQTIISICREFNINEDWLRFGKGEMYCYQGSSDEFQAAMEEIGVNDPQAREIILDYWRMSPSEKENFWQLMNKLIKKNEKDLS